MQKQIMKSLSDVGKDEQTPQWFVDMVASLPRYNPVEMFNVQCSSRDAEVSVPQTSVGIEDR